MSATTTVTVAYILLRLHSETLTVPELEALAAFTPTATGAKGTRVRPETRELPANYIALGTEALSSSYPSAFQQEASRNASSTPMFKSTLRSIGGLRRKPTFS
jgi:hypothetical protein